MPKIFYDDKNKRYYLQGFKNGSKKKFYSSAKSKTQAKQELNAKYNKWMSTERELGFKDAWELYVDDYSKRFKASSTSTLMQRGKSYLLPEFGNRPIHTIEKMDYQKVINKAFERELAKKTIEGIATTITGFTRFCNAVGYLDKVYDNFFIPAGATVAKKRALYPTELQELLTTDDDSWYIPHFRFLALTGIRRGELCALQTERDFERPYITIRETLSHELILGSPKSGKERKEYLHPLALDALDLHWSQRTDDCPYLFCSTTGQRINPKVLSENWRHYRKRHNLGKITLHELRHTFATYGNKNLDIDQLKAVLGHSKSMDTVGTYVHDIPLTEAERLRQLKEDQERATKLEAIFRLISDL